MMHWGAIIVPPGYSDSVIYASGWGNPYGASATADGNGLTDELKASVQHQARRTLSIAAKLKA
ncbi:NAD(P)H:quinone oxidoreductase type IV [Oligella ureolytica]